MVPNGTHPHKIEVSWDDAFAGNFPESPARQLFTNTVITVAAQAKAALPEANGRVDRARDLVLGGLVSRNADGTFTVRSQSERSKTYVVNGACTCPDAEKAPDGRCKHLISSWIWRKARKAVEEQLASDAVAQQPAVPSMAETAASALPEAPRSAVAPGTSIPVQFLVELHGKQFVTYGGLLAMAHEKGLVRLASRFISVDGSLALAEANAKFADGRTFQECADATPENVNARIRPHYPRMALTRAKARALRDALNIQLVCVEELEGS